MPMVSRVITAKGGIKVKIFLKMLDVNKNLCLQVFYTIHGRFLLKIQKSGDSSRTRTGTNQVPETCAYPI